MAVPFVDDGVVHSTEYRSTTRDRAGGASSSPAPADDDAAGCARAARMGSAAASIILGRWKRFLCDLGPSDNALPRFNRSEDAER